MSEHKLLEKPIPTLRQKYEMKYDNDLQLFQSLALGDTWPDAQLRDVYLYLWSNKKLSIPQAWKKTMIEFTQELRAVTCQDTIFGCDLSCF